MSAPVPVIDLLRRIAALAEARERGYAERRHGGVVNSQCANGLVELLPEIQAAACGLARMSAPDVAPVAVLVVEQARVKSSGAPVGLRLTTRPGGQSLLVFYDQVAMPGFRLGDAFIADPDDPLAYSILDLKPAEAAR